MLASDVSHPEVTLAVDRDEANGRAYLGAVIGEAFVPFFEQKLALFDDLLKLGNEQAAKRAQEQAAQDQGAQAAPPPAQ